MHVVIMNAVRVWPETNYPDVFEFHTLNSAIQVQHNSNDVIDTKQILENIKRMNSFGKKMHLMKH